MHQAGQIRRPMFRKARLRSEDRLNGVREACMRSRTGLAAAILVLGGGVGLALLFKNERPAAVETVQPLETVRRRGDDGPRFLMEVRSTPPEWPQASEPSPSLPGKVEPIAALTGLPLFEARHDSPPQIASQYPPSEEPVPPWIVHRVVDGDTLASLARRYLKDEARQQEIYDANHDTLSDPELLPIGLQLKIPSK